MTDIAEELRMEMRGDRHADLARRAADEIERLETENERLRAALERADQFIKFGYIRMPAINEAKP